MKPDALEDAFMNVALEEARAALSHGDVPIGCVIVDSSGIELARAHNAREETGDPTAHAELLALKRAAEKVGSWRLVGTTMYVTLEPCPMCAGALVLARVKGLVYGADDPKAGAVGSLYDIVRDPRLNHRLDVRIGVRAEEAAALLKAFFKEKRADTPPI
ncbi:MAG: tRNA adenosine(34) deaminase TadA [Actinomycetota bacterium]